MIVSRMESARLLAVAHVGGVIMGMVTIVAMVPGMVRVMRMLNP
jgi:hypothetical protein